MIERFLKAKHWQLFLLLIGVPLVFQVVMTYWVFSEFKDAKDVNHEEMISVMKYVWIIMLLMLTVFFGWFWSIGVGLQRVIPESERLNDKLFKGFLLYPLFYIALFLVLNVAIFMNEGLQFPGLVLLLIPLHLFAMFCMFYALYFVAKTYRSALMQKKAGVSDYIGDFFLIWFFPIGIWFVQPNINKLIRNGSDESTNTPPEPS